MPPRTSSSFFGIRATENRSIEYVREFRMRRTREKVITLVDDERSETYATLDEAIRAAQTWYLALAGGKLPIWNYSVETLWSAIGLRQRLEQKKIRMRK